MIILGPGVKGGHQTDAFTYITDIMPTLLEIAGLEHPQKYQGREVAPMRGHSITGLLSGDTNSVYDAEESVGAEMAGGKWLRQGDFKAVFVPPPFGAGEWLLFDLSNDPGETNDLAEINPQKLAALKTAWDQYAQEVGVVEISGPISR
jgi:arylsulfatase